MILPEMLSNIEQAYSIISDRLNIAKNEALQLGQTEERVHYEDISLEDIMDSLLLPLLPKLIDNYLSIPFQTRSKAYRVYVASLCELVKNGLVNGGILKTMDARMGVVFDRNHHYDLLQRALRYEGIQVFENKHRKYEETIINEAGIPRNYHTVCLDIFSIYWKWLRNFEFVERKAFLTTYFDNKPLDKIYIVDRNDSIRLDSLKDDTKSFSQKVIKTCIKLDAVFSAIDDYSSIITEENINGVANEISAIVGFNILSVVRSQHIRGYILDYAKKVSFLKFERILASMPGNEEIVLPNGCKKKIAEYKQCNYLGGRHHVRGNAYDVSFPISLTLDELFAIPMQKIHMIGNAILYVSDEPIIAEIDGVEKPSRTFVNSGWDYRYIFYERIPAASFAYIDGKPVDIVSPFLRKAYIGKYWDPNLKQYQLGLFLSDIRFADDKATMCPIMLKCNGRVLLSGATNHNGAYRVRDKLCFVDDVDLQKPLELSFWANDKVIEKWEIIPDDLFLWNVQTGIRINEKIDISTWFGPPKGLIFSKKQITYCSTDFDYLYTTQGYFVYSVNLDFSATSFSVNEYSIPILKSETPYLVLKNKMDVFSGEYCIEEREPISIDIANYSSNGADCYLIIEHDTATASYNLKNLQPADYNDISILICNKVALGSRFLEKAGKWALSLVQNNKRISELNVVVIPYINICPLRPIFSEGDDVLVSISSRSACFESEGEFVPSRKQNIGKAKLTMVGNHVSAEAIEFDCYIDKCGITKHLKFIPHVWALRQKSTDLWETITKHRLEYDDLNRLQVFVCSTTEMQLSITSSDMLVHRYIRPGYNRIDFRDTVNTWNKRTDISFVDEYSCTQELAIYYSPKINVISAMRKAEGLSLSIKYQGPVASVLNIRVYSGSRLATSAERKIYNNQFFMQIWVFSNQISNPDITVEARIDGEDYQTIFHEKCEALPEELFEAKLDFSKDTGLLELLEYSLKNKNHDAKKMSQTLLQLLSER